jgi:hypothetical protein
LKRSIRKKEIKAARKARRRDPNVKSGFRKLVLNGSEVWQWRFYPRSDRTEIRVPGTIDLKWMVPTWQLRGCSSLEEWAEPHKDCYDECLITGDLGCGHRTVTPGLVKAYIDDMNQVTSK